MSMNSQILSKEQVLIVGCGDIGARVSQILADNYAITGLRRNPTGNSDTINYQACDVTDPIQLVSVIQQGRYDVVLITMTPGERSDSGYERAYVQTCRNLVDALRQNVHQPRLALFVSSTAVYGQDDGSWVDEDSITEPESFSGKRLLQAERIIQSGGLTAVIIRFSGIYGPGRNYLLEQIRQGRANMSAQITNRIHADDCAGVIAHLINMQRQQILAPIYIGTDSAPVSMAEVVGWLAEKLGVALPVVEHQLTAVPGNKYCSNRRLLSTGFQFMYADYRAGYKVILSGLASTN